MGLSFFGSSSSSEPNYIYPTPQSPNPDPRNFEILKCERRGKFCVSMVYYPDAESYEGKKVIVTQGISRPDIRKLDEFDPHFYEDGKVIARFRPTSEGWKDAIYYAERKSSNI